MKKQIIYGLSLIFLAAGLNSCGKTTKRKITNDWKIVSLEQKQESIYNQNSQGNYWKSTMNETTVSINSVYYNLDANGVPYTSVNETTGEVKENKLSIKKDGTWEWAQELVYTDDPGNGNQHTSTTGTILSGTWSFVGRTKGDDFKKNERLLMNILVHKNSILEKDQTSVLNDFSDETTYLTGENTMTFTVKESSKKEMRIEMESSSKNSFSGLNLVKSLKMTLKEEE
ncbi:MAG: hypothetical protein ACO1N0_16350 [Fluviicola sp.]